MEEVTRWEHLLSVQLLQPWQSAQGGAFTKIKKLEGAVDAVDVTEAALPAMGKKSN